MSRRAERLRPPATSSLLPTSAGERRRLLPWPLASARTVAAAALGLLAGVVVAAFVVGFDEPDALQSVWRFVGRGSGSIALALLGLGTFGGIALRGELPSRMTLRFGRSKLTRAHMLVGVFGVVFTGVHLASVFAVAELGIGWLQLFVPFTRVGGQLAQGFGVIAGYLLLAVLVTSALQRRLPWRWWRRVHMLTVPLFAMATVHTVLAASWATPLFLPSVMSASALLVTVPVLHWRPARRGSGPRSARPRSRWRPASARCRC